MSKNTQTHADLKTHSAASGKETTVATDSVTAQASSDQSNLESGSYSVHSGDSLWKVAEEKLGDATRWPDIYKLNVDKIGANPDLIHPGLKLDLPEHAQNIATPTQPSSEYIVQSGDNLWDIAKHVSGSGTHWSEIYHANANVIGNNPSLIFPGEKLNLPSGESSTVVADASGATTAPPAASSAPVVSEATQVSDSNQLDATAPAAQPSAQPAPTAAPNSAQPATSPAADQKLALSGAGGAQAAELTKATTKTADASIVSPSLAPDLSFFARKR
jgi:LysM repeat protein